MISTNSSTNSSLMRRRKDLFGASLALSSSFLAHRLIVAWLMTLSEKKWIRFFRKAINAE